jgi:hypothetical protein
MPVPDFSPGEIWTAGAADSIGLWLVKTQTIGTGVSAQTVTDAFSATYDDYLINISGGTTTGNTNIDFKLGAVTSGYRFNYVYGSYASGTPAVSGTTSGGNIPFVGFGNTVGLVASINVLSPFLACPTAVYADGGSLGSFTGRVQGFDVSNTAFTSFVISLGSGTMTGGTIRVYGIRK